MIGESLITVLCGGVGGAKLVQGLAHVLPDPSQLSIIVNTGDDWDLLDLHISPDVDTVLYTLAGLISPERGWGLADETWGALELLGRYGFPTWFRIGDRDLATHIARTVWLRQGRTLTDVTRTLGTALGVAPQILPMSNDRVATVVDTPVGRLPFQEYFVARGARDAVLGIELEGIDQAQPTAEVLEAVRTARVIVIAPSNPLVSIGPILALPGMRDALAAAHGLRMAVTPLVAGHAIKGPTVEMLRGVGLPAEPAAVARLYRDFLDVFVLDIRDSTATGDVASVGVPQRALAVECTDTVMMDIPGRRRLAQDILRIAAASGVEIPASRR
jgi:LPPG:FO 2-phospho-L-lactate transferase